MYTVSLYITNSPCGRKARAACSTSRATGQAPRHTRGPPEGKGVRGSPRLHSTPPCMHITTKSARRTQAAGAPGGKGVRRVSPASQRTVHTTLVTPHTHACTSPRKERHVRRRRHQPAAGAPGGKGVRGIPGFTPHHHACTSPRKESARRARCRRRRHQPASIRVYISVPSQWSHPPCATLCTTDLLLKPAQPLTIFGMQRLIHVVVRRRKAVTVQAWLTIKINPLGLCAAGGQ